MNIHITNLFAAAASHEAEHGHKNFIVKVGLNKAQAQCTDCQLPITSMKEGN